MNTVYLAVGLWGMLFLGAVVWVAWELRQNVDRKKDVSTNSTVVDLSERRKKKSKISFRE